MRAITLLAALLTLAVGAAPTSATESSPALCGTDARALPVPGRPGLYRVETSRGTRLTRVATRSAASVDVTVQAGNFIFNADANLATQVDTVRITAGQTVRWHLLAGFHTVTSGTGSGDPEAGAVFDALLQTGATDFDFTFTDAGTYPYFCSFHELSQMRGVVVVSAAASAPGTALASRIGFSRPPAPNPARGSIGFTVSAPRAGEATLDILDTAGRRVATLFRGELPAGERGFRWDGRDAAGRPAAPGAYRVRLSAPGVREARAFTLVR